MDGECIEDNIPTEEEQSRLRQDRLTEIGKLPMSYGILTVILSPNKDISIQVDGLAFFEVLGLTQFVRIRTERVISFMGEEDLEVDETIKQTIQ